MEAKGVENQLKIRIFDITHFSVMAAVSSTLI